MVESEHLDKGVGSEAEPAGASAPATSPAPPGPPSPNPYPNLNRKGRPKGARTITMEEMDAFCELAACGVNPGEIAAIVGVTKQRISQLMKRNRKRIEYLRVERLKLEVQHAIGLPRLLPKSREVLAKTLDYGSEKERVSTAKWVHEKLVADPTHKSEVRVEAEVRHDLRPMIEQMGEHLRVLRERVQERDPLARVVVGTAARVRQQLGSGE